MAETIVFDDHTHYVGYVDLGDGEAGWYRWPAEADGWSRRKPIVAPEPGAFVELAPFNARLALRLSGATP